MTGLGPGRPGVDPGSFPRRPRWLLIVVAVGIIVFAALALRVSIENGSSPTTSQEPSGASDVTDNLLAEFTHTCEGTTCSFEDDSDTSELVTDWKWDFGDGEEASGTPTTTHTYPDDGVYRVSLTITLDSGKTGTVTRGLNPGATQGKGDVLEIAPRVYPFGPHIGSAGGWELLDSRFTAAHVSSHPETVTRELNAAQADGKTLILLLARSAGNYKNPDGTFNLDMWKAEIDLYAGFDFRPWVEDGTLLVHYLISEPMSRSRWGGEVIPAEVLDEMARYSKQYWPYLATTVREQPADLIVHGGGYETPVPGWRWSHLDAGWARYSARKGDIDEFIEAEVAAAQAQGLGLLFGMNVLAGGDGSSEEVGHQGGSVMSPDELLEYGTKLIDEPYGCANMMWHLNHGGIPYFDLPEIESAMAELAETARSREPIPCTRS